MLNYTIDIKNDIIIKIKQPKGVDKQDLKTLGSLKNDLDLLSFIEWIDWMPIHPRDEEWAYWEAKAGTISPLGQIREELENRIKELKEENKKLREENSSLLQQVRECQEIIETKSWPSKSRVIALKEENEKLKHKLEAYEHHKKK